MKIYLAGAWSRREELRGYADDVGLLGLEECVSRWLWVEEQEDQPPEADLDRYAEMDIEDVRSCDLLVLFSGGGRGGRHVETGVALALGKPVLVVGERENIFHHLCPCVGSWRDVQPVVEWLMMLSKRPLTMDDLREAAKDQPWPGFRDDQEKPR